MTRQTYGFAARSRRARSSEGLAMDADGFDALARSLTATGSRRRALAVLSGVFGLALGTPSPEAAAAKKTCPPCKKRNKQGKCKKKPNGTPCADGSCQRGSCVAAAARPCVPESAGTTCAGRCGTWSNTCGKAVKCPQCPDGQICLTNGSCALPCTGMGSCPAACLGCPTTFLNTEGQTHCVGSSSGTFSCTSMQTCTKTSQCPSGTQCQPCAEESDLRCAPLCTG